VLQKVDELAAQLRPDIRIKVDERENYKPGWKFNEWEMKGVPLRMEIGPRDVAANNVVIARRNKGPKEKLTVSIDGIEATIQNLLEEIQQAMFDAALAFREENSHKVDSYDEFKQAVEEKGGFLYAHWCGDSECEQKVQDETKATIRCIPFGQEDEAGTCMCCGKASERRVPFAKAY
jgi:prolyl-tRNA synthetase